jgi:cytochrome c biogenesis protein CcdA
MSQIEGHQATSKSGSWSTVVASLAVLGSVIAASSCCLPLLPFLFAAGAAGTSAFVAQLRPYLLVLSVLLIAFGFYKSWRAKHFSFVVLGVCGVCVHLFPTGHR